MKTQYAARSKKNLIVYEIPEKNLKGFTTTEKDKKRGIERYPLENFRNYSHDIIKEDKKDGEISKSQAGVENEQLDHINDYEQKKLIAFETVD